MSGAIVTEKKKKRGSGNPPGRASALSSDQKLEEGDTVVNLLHGLRSEIGEENALILGDNKLVMKIRGVVSTRIPSLDLAIGRGGIPLGRLTILYGKEGSGKTTVALQIVSECQSMGGYAVYFDCEYKLDPDYAEKLGVDTKRLIISQPSSLEDVIKGIHKIIDFKAELRKRTGKSKPCVIILDSINACKSKESLEREVGEKNYPPEARIWSEQLSNICAKASREDVALLFISQIRAKIGVVYGDAEEIAGGNAPKYHASLVMRIVRVGSEIEDGTKVANKIEAECRKNQIAPPFKKGEFLIRYGVGADFERSLLLQATELGTITKKGNKYFWKDQELGLGVKEASKFLKENPEYRDKLNKIFRKKMGWVYVDAPS